MRKAPASLEGITPFTLKVALAFSACITYFISDMYFMATEYYAESPPYVLLVLLAFICSLIIFLVLRMKEPDRTDSAAFSMLFGLGIAFALYAFIPRLNIMTDASGLNSFHYTLSDQYIWKSLGDSPDLELFLRGSRWWEQFKPGDEYVFQLRKGGLGIWLVDMSDIYRAQKEFYECSGFSDCIFVDSYQ